MQSRQNTGTHGQGHKSSQVGRPTHFCLDRYSTQNRQTNRQRSKKKNSNQRIFLGHYYIKLAHAILTIAAGPPLNISVYITVVSFGAVKEINMVRTLTFYFALFRLFTASQFTQCRLSITSGNRIQSNTSRSIGESNPTNKKILKRTQSIVRLLS